MTVLLDTHVLLGAAGAPDQLPPKARAVIEDPGTTLVYSTASVCAFFAEDCWPTTIPNCR